MPDQTLSNAAKLEDAIPGVMAVAAKDNKLFVCIDKTVDPDKLALVFKEKEYPFEKVGQKQVRRVDFREELNTGLLLDPLADQTILSGIGANVNTSGDWCYPGATTLQIGLDKESAPYRVLLPRRMELRNIAGPVHVRGKLAVHRAHATLLLTVIDLDNGRAEKHAVPFEPAHMGGAKAVHYQHVDVLLPAKFRNVAVEVSIEYHGFAGSPGEPQPFLFLAGLHLLEGNPEDELPREVSRRTSKGTWLQAKARESITGLTHCLLRVGGRYSAVLTYPVDAARASFDDAWYAEQHPELDPATTGYFSHYLLRGWKQNYRPNRDFSVREYLLRHPDVDAAGYEPLIHYVNVGKTAGRFAGTFDERVQALWEQSGEAMPDLSASTILRRAQDLMVPLEIVKSRKLAVFVIPEHDAMSGGIYSMFSIAGHLRRMRRRHGFDVILMTRPNPGNTTYIRNSAFSNSETVFNIEQLQLFSEVSELQLYIPEYATVSFVRYLSEDLLKYIVRRDHVHINILNQNTRLMPEPDQFRDLRRIADSIGQSVSHHAYFGQEFADHYNLPSLLLPAYTDLSAYPPAPFEEKESIILYSDDDAPYRDAVLNKLSTLTDYTLVKVQSMSFDRYMDYATRCRFSISFGEGFDGYVAQPIYQGGIGFAVYTDEFFPDPTFKKFDNFFNSDDEMIEKIVPTIRRLESSKSTYESLNKALRKEWDKLYNYDDYVSRIGDLVMKKYELFPQKSPA